MKTPKTPKTPPYLVSDRAFRVILTEVIDRLTAEEVTPACFYAVLTLVKTYLKEGEVSEESMLALPVDGYSFFVTFREMMDSSIRRARSARAAAVRRKEKKAALAREEEAKPFSYDTWPPQSAGEPSQMVKDLKAYFANRHRRSFFW